MAAFRRHSRTVLTSEQLPQEGLRLLKNRQVKVVYINQGDITVNQETPFQTDPLKSTIDNPSQFKAPSNPISPIGGPQFGSIEPPRGGFRGWLSRYGSSVILPIIALIILASGIYLYATQKTQTQPFSDLSEQAANQEGALNLGAEEPGTDQNILQPAAGQEKPKTEIKEIVPASRTEGRNIIETAVKGDSITRLARRAIGDYLKDQPQNLSHEQRVYAEDYLKDQTAPRRVGVGDELSFSQDLIKQAIDASLQLSPNQLKNLEKYSALINW